MNKRMSFLKLGLLYFVPGLIPTIGLVLFYFTLGSKWPSIFPFLLIELGITLPVFIIIMKRFDFENFNKLRFHSIVKRQQKLSAKNITMYTLLSLIWAVLCFVFLKDVSTYLREFGFSWLPHWFDLGNYITHKDKFHASFPLIIWFMLTISSIVFPIAEEIYFRDFLLTKTNHLSVFSPILNTILFALYHIWSIWMAPQRILAIFPMIYFVWKKKNIFIGIIVHCSLNIVGDVILMAPYIFSSP